MRAGPWHARVVLPRSLWWRIGLLLWLLVALLLGLTLVRPGVDRSPGTTAPANARAGGPAPDFKLSLYDGGAFQLSEQRGKVVVVNFWASWCVPCRTESPRLEAAYRRYGERGVAFVGVDIQDTRDNALAFLHEFGLTYPNGLDEGMGITQAYQVVGLPTTFVVDGTGQIRQRWEGELQDGQLDGLVQAAVR